MSFLHYVEQVTGVSVYGMASFFIFFTFFVVMALWAWKADKKLIDNLTNLPLDEGTITN